MEIERLVEETKRKLVRGYGTRASSPGGGATFILLSNPKSTWGVTVIWLAF